MNADARGPVAWAGGRAGSLVVVCLVAVLSSEAVCLAAYVLLGMRLTMATPIGRVMLLAPAVTPALVAPAMSIPMARTRRRLVQALKDMGLARDALVQEVASRQEIQERLEFLVCYDPLTEVLNRRGFFDAAGAGDKTRALLIFDIDDFKLVNDRLGHLAGDHVLRAVATALTREAGPSAAVARLGGDEFVVLLDDLAAAQSLTAEPRSLVVELGDGATITVSASTGMALLGPGQDIDGAIAAADRRMYANKRDRVRARRRDELPRPRRAAEPARRLTALSGRLPSDDVDG